MVERKVKFFRAVDGDGQPLDGGFQAMQVLRLAREMARHGTAELDIGLGRRLIAKALSRRPEGHHMVLYQVRGDDLPMLYENGAFRPLADVIHENADIAEPTHFAFFPDDVLGHLYNHYGPKPVQLSKYLFETMQYDVLFDAIARDDVLTSIANAGGVRLFRFPRAEDLGRFEGMSLDGMRALADDLPVGDVEVVLRATTPEQKRSMGRALQQIVTRARRGDRSRYIETAKVAMTDADDLSEGREVDVFTDPIVLTQEVATIPGQRRYLEESSAMDALETAYQRIRSRLD